MSPPGVDRAVGVDPALDLRVLSTGELLVIWRQRTASPSGRALGRSGRWLSQAEAAAHVGLRTGTYRRIEGDRMTNRHPMTQGLQASVSPTLGDLCFIARRRSKRLLMEIERELKVSRPTLHEMERSGHPAIVRLWEREGYVFP